MQIAYEMKKLIFPFLFLTLEICAQTISPSVINSTGNSAVILNTTVEWNVGECVVSTMQTSSGVSITSGQLQPFQTTVGVKEIREEDVTIFPVPAMNELNIAVGEQIDLIRLFDATGRLVIEEKPIHYPIHLDLSMLSAGVYQVVLYNSNPQKLFSKSISKVN